MNGAWRDRCSVGSCNFCTDTKHKKVFEFMRDESGGLMVRICKKCLKELKRISKK